MSRNRFLRQQAERGLSPLQHVRALRFSGSERHHRLYCAQDDIYCGHDGNGYPLTTPSGQSDDGVPAGYRRSVRGYQARRYGITITASGKASGKAGGSWSTGGGAKGGASGSASGSAGASGGSRPNTRPDRGPKPRKTTDTREGITGHIVPMRISEKKDLTGIRVTPKLLGPETKLKPSPTLPPAPDDLPGDAQGCVQEDGNFLRMKDPQNKHHGMQLQNVTYFEADGVRMARFSMMVGDRELEIELPVCTDGTKKEDLTPDCCVELVGNGGAELKSCGSYNGLIVTVTGEREDQGVMVVDVMHPDLPGGAARGLPVCAPVEEQPEDKPCCIDEETRTIVCPEDSPFAVLNGQKIPAEYCDYEEDDHGRKICNVRCPEEPSNEFEQLLARICKQFGGAKFPVCEPEDPKIGIVPRPRPQPTPCFNPDTGMLEAPDGSMIPVKQVIGQDETHAVVVIDGDGGRKQIKVPLCPTPPPPPPVKIPPELPPSVPGREPPGGKIPPERKPCPEKVPEACCFDHNTSSISCEGSKYHGLVVKVVEEVVLENGQRIVAVEHPSLPGGGMRMTYCAQPPEVDIYDDPVEEEIPEVIEETPPPKQMPEPPPPTPGLPEHCCWSTAEQRIKCAGTRLDKLRARVLINGIVKDGYPMVKVQHRMLPGGVAVLPICPTECMEPTQMLDQEYRHRGYNYTAPIADMPGNFPVPHREVEYPGLRGATGRAYNGVGVNVGYRGLSQLPGARGAGQTVALRGRKPKGSRDGATLFCKTKNNIKRCHMIFGAAECFFDRAGRAWCCWQGKCIASDEILLPGMASLVLDSMHNEHRLKLNRQDSVKLFKAIRKAIKKSSYQSMDKQASRRRYGMTRIGKDRRASRYNWQPALRSLQGMQGRAERGRVGMEFPPNLSGRMEGYNTKMFRTASDLSRVLRALGYEGMDQDMTRQFQTHWNYVSQRIATSRDFQGIPMYRVPKGNLVADGRPGPLTLNAIEAAFEIQNAGVPWASLVQIAENPSYGPRRKLHSAFLGE